ncbi:unnamed protein product [Clavelina lepadiformis]|uniref:Dipeptidyl-peptidase IV n=1 Tax=Clavelina lepadiformis TaxID=159417 RepID=A0ABP0FA11_CLALP
MKKVVGALTAVTIVLLVIATLFAVDKNSTAGREKRSSTQKFAKVEENNIPNFSFKDIWSSKFSYKSVSPQWISGTQYIYMDSERNVKIRDVTTLNDTKILPGDEYINNGASSYKVSSTQEYILLLTKYVKGWRHSYNGTYLVYDVTAKLIRDDISLPENIQYITWSPVGNALAYVQGFDIYYKANPMAAEERVTTTGRANFVYNGIPDWVYEEEMISSNNVLYFSPGGTKLAFAQFNDTLCDHIEFIRYDDSQYPNLIDVSYPKAGTTQPTSKAFVYDIGTNITEEILPPKQLSDNGDYLFNRVTWANDTRAAVLWCDRLQTWSITSMCDEDGTKRICFELPQYEHKTPNGWLYQRRPYWIPVFAKNENVFFKVLPNNGWQHLARVDDDGTQFLTQGNYTVTSVSASYPAVDFYHVLSDYVYFLATIEGPGKRQVYRTKGHRSTADVDPDCITCKLITAYPGRCNYVTASFSIDGSYTIVRCRGEGAPLYIQYKLDHSALNQNDVLIDMVVLENNTGLVEAVSTTLMSDLRHGTIPSTTGYEFYYKQWNPPDFDETKKYPLLIDVYAGPGYQNVNSLWTRSWAPAYVPVGLGAIVVRIDGRGSNFYGDNFMHEVYRALGQKEVEDQIEAARYFGKLPYVDENRIAIWGWSYGGFTTSHAIGLDTDILKCGMAVAPLVDWRYYDTIYAERYMGLPADNHDGYENASVVNKAANFPQSSFYLIHGMADDNVHFQNAAQLEKELVKEDITFNDFFYADQDHSINRGNAYYHVYQILTKQLCECFGIPVPKDVWQLLS